MFNPSFDFGEIPGDAAVCQIEATRDAALQMASRVFSEERGERYWRAVLPDSNFELAPAAGRFMAMTHPDRVVRILRR